MIEIFRKIPSILLSFVELLKNLSLIGLSVKNNNYFVTFDVVPSDISSKFVQVFIQLDLEFNFFRLQLFNVPMIIVFNGNKSFLFNFFQFFPEFLDFLILKNVDKVLDLGIFVSICFSKLFPEKINDHILSSINRWQVTDKHRIIRQRASPFIIILLLFF
jgi:hypothetical protein